MMKNRPALWLVEWLAKEDDSAFGECVGVDFDNLLSLGLVEFVTPPLMGEKLTGYERVRLSPHGWTLYALIRADKLVDWMAHYVGKMAPGSYSECYLDLNKHFHFMQQIKPPKQRGDDGKA